MFLVNVIKKLITNNPAFARSGIDCIAFGMFILGGHLAIWFELYHVLPFYEGPAMTYSSPHIFIALAFYVLTFSNLYYLINTPSTGAYLQLCARKEESWRYCGSCEAFAPPRCHHCKVCATCILKRDHHCWFAGCCVGYHNYRYFFCMVATVTSAAIYANVYHREFVLFQMGGFSVGTMFCIVFPHVAGMLGYLSLYQFFIALMTFVALLCLLLFSWLLSLQCLHLYHGQTEYERKISQTQYNLGVRQNLIGAFGRRWYLVLLSPWIRSDLPGDGLSFMMSEKVK